MFKITARGSQDLPKIGCFRGVYGEKVYLKKENVLASLKKHSKTPVKNKLKMSLKYEIYEIYLRKQNSPSREK